ncbi:TolC family protein [Bacteroides caccae]|jgi:outer membrane protein TolC|uniref:Outer membrane protein n=4 Tax=Bacteroides caccae TaxID=47678 RepID=A0A174PLJ3_9BACE|nr:TolC family protein [Bacteroides caccae]KAA5480016.1 TolC family protein [Bacteroides caccae]KAA5483010.1 TolC family protein [Bacteroides caccae]MCE8460749.1 TolC family protein [Bacteroides caccae]MCE8773122.1 TolC family protein [Bacteroides caccae]MCE9460794.1 TolC family protein [Bacteroides caccae]
MKMRKGIFSLLFCTFVFLSLPVLAQQSTLLEKYRTMALDYNHDLKAAEKNIAASMEVEKSARADLKPKLSGAASFQYTGNPMELTLDIPSIGLSKTVEGKNLNYGGSLSILQPVYTGGRVLESIRMAQHQQALVGNQAKALNDAVCYQTDIQYWSAVARQEIVDVAEDFRNSIAALVKTIKERVEVGLVDPQDLLMAEVKLNEAEYQLLQAQSNFETGRMALNSMIGVRLEQPTELDAQIPIVVVSDSLWLSTGMGRPEIQMAYDKIRIAESTKKLNDSQFKPQFYVGVEGSYSSPGYNFKKDLDPNYAVYAKVSVPIFEWGKRRSEKRVSSFRIGMAEDNLNKVVDRVELEVSVARKALSQAIERVRLSESSLAKAEENEAKAVERYNEGKVSVVEVIDAQTYRQTSQVNYVQAKAAAQGHYSELIKALHSYDYR